jgi:hypothetical protein
VLDKLNKATRPSSLPAEFTWNYSQSVCIHSKWRDVSAVYTYSKNKQAILRRHCSTYHTLTHWLTHSLMEKSPSWEAANCAASQELPSALWNPKVHYRVHKSPPLVPILSQFDPFPTIPSYLSKIHFNIVHPPTSSSSQWSLSFRISHQYLPHSCYMPCLSHTLK